MQHSTQEGKDHAVKQYMQEMLHKGKSYADILEKRVNITQTGTAKTRITKAHYELAFTRLKNHKLQGLLDAHDLDTWHQIATFPGKDIFAYKDTPQDHQLHFIGTKTLRRSVGLDAFITHYSPENNYKEGSDLYQKHKGIINPIIIHYVQHGNEKILEKNMKELFRIIKKDM